MLIYQIIHIESGYRYVGQTTRPFLKRKREHLYPLRKGKHHNRYLQAAWNKYGEKAFQFQIVKEVSSLEELNKEEQILIANGTDLYNLAEGGNVHVHSVKTKEVIGEASKKPIVGMSIRTREIKEYDSAADAAKDGFDAACIRKCVLGFVSKRKDGTTFTSISTGGYVWISKEFNNLQVLNKLCDIAKRGKIRRERPVVGMNVFDKSLVSFASASEAGRNGFQSSNVYRACGTYSAVHKGHVWVFADAYNPQSLLENKRTFVLSKTRTGPKSWQYREA